MACCWCLVQGFVGGIGGAMVVIGAVYLAARLLGEYWGTD